LQTLGTQLVLEMWECSPDILKDLNKIKDIMVSAANQAKATIVEVTFHEFNPFGISGMVIIAESHLSIHTWPEYGYAAVDIFTCGDLIKPEVAADYLVEKFECRKMDKKVLDRGIPSLENATLPHKMSQEEMERYATA
jgi:S-adenosylmethionine decarboxylase